MPTLALDLTDTQLTTLDKAAAAELRTRESQALWYLTAALDARTRGQDPAAAYWQTAHQGAARRRSWDFILTELRALHQQAGRPSTRTIAAATADSGYRTVSHTTVSEVLAGTRIPAHWPVVQSITAALGGSETRIFSLWNQVP